MFSHIEIIFKISKNEVGSDSSLEYMKRSEIEKALKCEIIGYFALIEIGFELKSCKGLQISGKERIY